MKDIYTELKEKGIDVYDKISVQWNNKNIEGMLLPKYEETGDNIILIKMNSGYNTGLRITNINNVKLLEKSKKQNKPKSEKNTATESVKNKIALLGCGGTIASKVEYKTGAVYPVSTKEDLEQLIPEIKELSEIAFIDVMNVLSEDMNPNHWEVIAKETANAIQKGAKGIVILHGTDTMHYTAAALSFALRNLPVPVILVGAQRSSDRPSTDSHSNFLNAVYSAEKDFGEVGVCMHGTTNDTFAYLHRGTKVRKMHTSRRDAFKSINIKPLVKVDYRKKLFEKITDYKKKSKHGFETYIKFNKNVALIYYYPGMKPEFVSSLNKFDGVVIAGTGLGHVSTNPFGDKYAIPIINEIKGLIESNIPVVLAPQTIYGRLNLNVYTAGRMLKQAGVIGDQMDWTPESAYVKLSNILAYEKDMKRIKEKMTTNIAGEITDRIEIEV